MPSDPVIVFTDGACSGNPGPGGWAWAVAPAGEPCGAGGERRTTNQRMELRAVLEALRALEGSSPIVVVSDSTYVVNCFRDRWWDGWRKRGWKNAAKQPVANRDLWEPLVDLVLGRGDVTFRWVKGHSGDRMNDLVDQLAVAASTSGPFDDGPAAPPPSARQPATPTPAPTRAPAPAPAPAPPEPLTLF